MTVVDCNRLQVVQILISAEDPARYLEGNTKGGLVAGVSISASDDSMYIIHTTLLMVFNVMK